MSFPKLRHPLICRWIPYLLVLSPVATAIILIACVPTLGSVGVVLLLGALVWCLWYMLRNFMVLMGMDLFIATIGCYLKARKFFRLRPGQSAAEIEARLSRFGEECPPRPMQPQPSMLRYRLCYPWSGYSSGIEKVAMVYRTDSLDLDGYRAILHSAKTNYRFLMGRKKVRFLEAQQKKRKLHRAGAVLILTNRVDADLDARLHELTARQTGDEYEDTLLPCVVDFGQGKCTFDSIKVPYIGFGIAAKSRAVALIRRLVFGGRLPLQDKTQAIYPKDYDPDMTLWQLWARLRGELKDNDQEERKLLSRMEDREIRMQDEILYLRWGEYGVGLLVHEAPDKLSVLELTQWDYPKSHKIPKKTIAEIQAYLTGYFRTKGITVEFLDLEAFTELDP